MTYNFSPAQVKWEITRLAKANPDFRYLTANNMELTESCLYVKDGQASCIVGQALHNLGVPLEEFEEHEQLQGSTTIKKILGMDDIQLEFHRKELEWIDDVQESQDANVPWLDSVERANVT